MKALAIATAVALMAGQAIAQQPKDSFLQGAWARPIPAALTAQACDAATRDRVKFGPPEMSDCVIFADEADAARFIEDVEARLAADGFRRWRDTEPPEPGSSDLRLYTRRDPADCTKVFMVAPDRGGQVWMGFIVKHCGGGKIG